VKRTALRSDQLSDAIPQEIDVLCGVDRLKFWRPSPKIPCVWRVGRFTGLLVAPRRGTIVSGGLAGMRVQFLRPRSVSDDSDETPRQGPVAARRVRIA
jgi:hypothetical protein